MAPDAIVVVTLDRSCRKSILDLPKYGCVNVHASLLRNTAGLPRSSGRSLTARRRAGDDHDDGCGAGYRRYAGTESDPVR